MANTDIPLTVGLPVYNDPDGLRRSVPTVFAQSWTGPVRLLIVDDGSTDETPAVINELAAVYEGIEVLTNDRNRGRPYTRNRILEHAGHGYLAWLDADDLWHPRKLEMQFATLSSHGVGVDDDVLCTTPFRWCWLESGREHIRVPQVDGDQLYDVMTGDLYPYLWTMLGPARAFRAIGGFDDRLPRRQDYEFLLRFLWRGGKVVSTPGTQPLCTYVKSDVGRSAKEVARANRVIGRKHAAVYRRYGRRFERECRYRRHRLVARFYDNNGQRFHAAFYRGRALTGTPLEWLVRRRVAAHLVRLVRTVRRLPREVSAQRRADSAAGEEDRGQRLVEDPATRIKAARQLLADRGSDAAITALLGSRPELTDELPLEGHYLLDDAWRQSQDFESAMEVVQRALDSYPDDLDLLSRRVELEALLEHWEACVAHWDALPTGDPAKMRIDLFSLVPRAFRMLDDHTRALQVAEAGARVAPTHRSIKGELYKARVATTDWKQSLVAATSNTGPEPGAPPAGTVDWLGFLRGDEGAISGRVTAPMPHAPTISVLVNDRPIATTNAAPTAEGSWTFHLNCQQAMEFLGDGDVISFTADDTWLDIAGFGPRCIVVTGYPSRSRELVRHVRSGHVFTKVGRLRRGYTHRRKAMILDFFQEVSARISQRHGYWCSPFYGNLLGAVREHDFVQHDVGGFDMGYVSSHTAPEDVRAEFLDICRQLVADGYHLRLTPWCAMIRPEARGTMFMDLNFGWFTPAGELQFSFGWRFEPVTRADRFHAPRQAPMAGRLVRIPGNAEDVLVQLYGDNWMVPDQGFDHTVAVRRNPDYLLTRAEMASLRDQHPDRVRIDVEELTADEEASDDGADAGTRLT